MSGLCEQLDQRHRDQEWGSCQNIYRLFALLDEFGYSESQTGESVLRQFACQCAQDTGKLIFGSQAKEALVMAYKVALGKLKPSVLESVYEAVRREQFWRFEEGTPAYYAATLAEWCVYPQTGVAAALAAKYSIKLGAEESYLGEQLKTLVGDPFVYSGEQPVFSGWAIERPAPTSVWTSLASRIDRWLDPGQSRFQAFLQEHSSLAEACEYCQNPRWLFAILDLYTTFTQTQTGQVALRKFACWCLEEESWITSQSEMAVQVAAAFANGQATRSQLKQAEIEAIEVLERHLDREYDRIRAKELAAASCAHQSARVAAQKTLEHILDFPGTKFPSLILGLRELVGFALQEEYNYSKKI